MLSRRIVTGRRHRSLVMLNAVRSAHVWRHARTKQAATMRYIITSKVGAEYVPVGKLYESQAEARAEALDLNRLLPSLRLTVVDVRLKSLSSQPVEIRRHVLRLLACY